MSPGSRCRAALRPAVAEDLAKLMPPGVEPIALFRALAHNPLLRRLRRGGSSTGLPVAGASASS